MHSTTRLEDRVKVGGVPGDVLIELLLLVLKLISVPSARAGRVYAGQGGGERWRHRQGRKAGPLEVKLKEMQLAVAEGVQ